MVLKSSDTTPIRSWYTAGLGKIAVGTKSVAERALRSRTLPRPVDKQEFRNREVDTGEAWFGASENPPRRILGRAATVAADQSARRQRGPNRAPWTTAKPKDKKKALWSDLKNHFSGHSHISERLIVKTTGGKLGGSYPILGTSEKVLVSRLEDVSFISARSPV